MEKSSYSSQSQSSNSAFNRRSMASPEIDHKSKMAELEQTIRQSEQKIEELTGELMNAKAKLEERDTTVAEYEERIEDLEQQLIESQKILEQSRNPSLDLLASDVSKRNDKLFRSSII